MFDTIVPLKAILGTLVMFAVFILLALTTLTTANTSPGLEWFMVPLLIGVSLCLLKCIQNIREIVRLKDEDANTEKTQVHLKTCPEYWVKDTVTIGEEGNRRRIPICKNYSIKDKSVHYVGGNNTNFMKNISGDDAKTMGSMQDDLNLRVEETTEPFTDPVEVRNPDSETGEPRVTFKDTDIDANKLTPLNEQDIPHFHHTGPLLEHTGVGSDGHANLTGYAFHTHSDGNDGLGSVTVRDNNYSSNWINYSPTDIQPQGVEINMDYLNQAENVCDLAKNFYWTEAYNKCKKNNEWNIA